MNKNSYRLHLVKTGNVENHMKYRVSGYEASEQDLLGQELLDDCIWFYTYNFNSVVEKLLSYLYEEYKSLYDYIRKNYMYEGYFTKFENCFYSIENK